MLWKKYALEDAIGTLAELESVKDGLLPKAAKERLERFGRNQIDENTLSVGKMFQRRLRSSFLYLLLAAAALSFFLGDRIDASLILAFIVFNIGLEMYQEYHSEKAVRLLRKYLVVHTRVRRGGRVLAIESREIVPGDIVLLEAGDRLPADVRFLGTNGLLLDESLLTGESVSVEKTAALLSVPPTEMYEAGNIGFAGTVVTAGHGEAVVFATGKETALGDIATLTSEPERDTVFEKDIRQFSRFILKLVLFTLAIIFFANIFIKGEGADVAGLLVFSLALAVSVVPEALPVIITVALSRGSLRLAQKKVVVKRLSAIEELGSIEVLCADKTGTLTENALSVTDVLATDKRRCLSLAFTASLEVPTDRGRLHDAFDLALWQALTQEERKTVKDKSRLDNIPFDPERRRNSVLVHSEKTQEIIVRGAPEEVISLTHGIDTYERRRLMEFVAEAGHSGKRVLAVARKAFSADRKYTVYEEQGLEWVGLIAFSDTLKKTAKQTIADARELGVSVKIITGDSKEVAGAVGYAVGLLVDPKNVLTGQELEALSERERKEALVRGAVFARVSPRQKYEIIKTLQERYEVGFLGEGINDAPALKLADVALVVQGASDIAREAADVVLLQKNLETVVDGIREGRAIFANILKYLKITLTSNFGNFYSVALASLFLPFVPLLPIQILLLNLLSDFPMIAIATDNVDAEELEKPKNYHIHTIVLMTTLLGVVSSVFDFILFGSFARVSQETLQTAWFLLSLATEVILIFSLRTRFAFFRAERASFFLTYFSLMVLAAGGLLLFTPVASEVFHFARPTGPLLLTIGGLTIGYFAATEIVKRFYYRHFDERRLMAGKKPLVAA